MKAVTSEQIEAFLRSMTAQFDVRAAISLLDGTRALGRLDEGPLALAGGALPGKPTSVFFPQSETVLTYHKGHVDMQGPAEKPLLVVGLTAEDANCLEFIDRFFDEHIRDNVYFNKREASVVVVVSGRCGPDNELLRIEATVSLPGGQSLHQTIWCDRAGNGLKSLLTEMGLETYRATKAQALEETEAADLGWGVAVEVEGPISDPHSAKQMSYRVRIKGGDPASVFVSGASQEIASVDTETADITVHALRPGTLRHSAFGDNDKPTSADMQPNSYIQSDNAKVVALAKKPAGDEKDPWKTVVKLEKFAGEHITEKGLSEAFATAAGSTMFSSTGPSISRSSNPTSTAVLSPGAPELGASAESENT